MNAIRSSSLASVIGLLVCVSAPAAITELTATIDARSSKVTLQWCIDQSDPGSVFEIMSSIDGKLWNTKDTMLGTETQDGVKFEYEDSNPYPGLNVYRIRQIHSSGDSALSEVRSVDFTPGGSCGLYAYPNPATSSLLINWEGCGVVNWDVVITNSAGKVVYYNYFAASAHQAIDISRLQPGNYTLTTEAKGSKTQQLHFVKQ